MQALDEILQRAKAAIQNANDLQTLDHCRVQFLGKKGELTEYLKTVGHLPIEQRPAAGQKINTAKTELHELILERSAEIKNQLVIQQLSAETIDVTLPGRRLGYGSLHPLTQTCQKIKNIFLQMGFQFMEGPEIEEDYYNFTALNIPPFHPARAMQDSFYFPDGLLLRSQMSPVQIHAMEKLRPPLRMVALGRVYRRDFDLTHTPMFHQMECLMIDEDITFAQLKGLLRDFLQAFFAADIQIRLRPSYFPFTEPSAEVDIGCVKCQSKGCRLCKNTGWLEILGCGMVHPNVLKNVEIDPNKYRGFAIGLGLDRLTLLKYGITDLRSLFENDLRFLMQY